MRAYLVRRLAALVPTLFIASLIVFVTVRLLPGDVIDMMIAQNDIGSKVTRQALEAALGLDQPMLTQYAKWIGGILLRGDFGQSLWQQAPVSDELFARLPVTFELGAMALIVAMAVALPIGIISAVRQDSWSDFIGRSFSILMLSIPGFWLGTVVMVFPAIWWGISPEVRYISFREDPLGTLWQLALPAIILGTSLSAVTMRMTRTMMLEVLRQDYIRTAWAKGQNERGVIIRHALRNALIPVVTLIGLQAPIVIGGAVIMEQIFVIPGMGLLLLEAVSRRDYPIITGVFLLVGLVVMLINLIVDLSYGLLDPKVRYR